MGEALTDIQNRDLQQAGFDLDSYFRPDVRTIRNRMFASSSTLEVKQRTHQNHRTNPRTIVDHIVEVAGLREGNDLLDLGCGNGTILAQLAGVVGPSARVTGQEIAPVVLRDAQTHFAKLGLDADWVEGSADDLSALPDDSYDVVTASYMFHYVPDFDAGCAEVKRVLRAGGRFVISTDSAQTMPEMFGAHFDALRRIGAPRELLVGTPKHRFSLENGESVLSRHFAQVTKHLYLDELVFEQAQPFMDFYALGYSFCCARSLPDVDLDDSFFEKLYEMVQDHVVAEIERTGRFVVSKVSGSFVCS